LNKIEEESKVEEEKYLWRFFFSWLRRNWASRWYFSMQITLSFLRHSPYSYGNIIYIDSRGHWHQGESDFN